MKACGRYNVAVTAARRKQILDAAAVCFRRDGFRGASMADISKTAGLSTGHIYHYFESKAAIVEAIVEGGQTSGKVFVDRIESENDIVRAIFQILVGGVTNREGFIEPVLLLESFAEASHNPMVAGIFREYDSLLQANLRKILKMGQMRGTVEEGADIDQIGLLLKAFLYGFSIHLALLPDFDAANLKTLLCFCSKAFVCSPSRHL